MNRSARLAFLSAASLLTSGVLLADSAPLPFAEATFTEIVNDVQIVSGANAQGRKVAKSDKFLAPDLVKTGRKSRAELKAADGTVARVGSNAVFSFDKSSRSMNLQSGSVLFHSPTGKGGGTVVTNSATASVIGTTIMVTATSDGGFKLLVLEGVAKVTLNGVVTQLLPGQMTFVLPAKSGESAKLGPVLNFDLDALVKDSSLVAGFEDSLASMGKIKAAIAEQGLKIEDGDLRKTGLFIIGANDENGFNVADAATLRQTVIRQQQGDQARLAESLRASFSYDGTGAIPESFIFRTPVFIDPAVLGLNIPAGDVNGGFVGLLVGHLDLNTSVFNLGFIDGAADTITVGGFQPGGLVIPGNITFNGLALSHNLRIVGGTLVIAPGSQIDVVFDNATLTQPVSAEFISLTGVTHTGVGFFNTTGNIEISAITGDLTLDSVTATAGTRTTTFAPLLDNPLAVITPGTLAPANLDLRAPLGMLTLIGGSYEASGDIRAEGAHGVSATATSFSADGRIEIVSAAATTLDAAVLDGVGVKIQGDTGVTLSTATSVYSQGSVNISSSTGVVALGDTSITAFAPIQSPGGITPGIALNPVVNSDVMISGNGVTAGAGSITASSGSVSIAGGAAGVAFTGTTISGGIVNIDGADITLDGGSVSASKIYIERSPGVLASTITVKNSASLDAFGGNFTEAGVNLRAGTIVLDGATFTDGTTATLRVTTGNLTSGFDGTNAVTGNANIHNTTYGSIADDVLDTNKVWVPTMNIGDVSAPIHILDATTADYRGTKLEYASSHALTLNAGSPFLPHSYEFTDNDAITLSNADLGLPDDTVLPDVDNGRGTTHSAYELTGVFAGDLTLNGAHLDLSAFDNNDQYQHVDVVAARMHLSGAITVDALSLVELLEFRAGSLIVDSGTTLKVGVSANNDPINIILASAGALNLQNFTLSNHGGDVVVASNTSVSISGGLLESDVVIGGNNSNPGNIGVSSNGAIDVNGGASIKALAGGVKIQSVSGVTVSGAGTTVTAGDVEVSSFGNVAVSAGALVESLGEVRIYAGDAQQAAPGDITLTSASVSAGYYDFVQGSLVNSGEVSLSANGAISVSAGDITVYGDSGQDTGSITLASQTVDLTNSTLRVVDQAATDAAAPGPAVYSGYIDITAALAVTIDGGFLKANSIAIKATDINNGIVSLDGVSFVGVGSSGSSTGVAISAKTVVVSNVNFPANVTTELSSETGMLNIGAAAGNLPVFGAVNFMKNVSVGGTPLVDGSGGANGGNISTNVWVQNAPGSSTGILVNGNTQTGVVSASSSTGAAIHILSTPAP